jgi:hypothetical protein
LALTTPKSESVTELGEPDGWQPTPGYLREMDPRGQTRLVVSVPVRFLLRVHQQLVASLQAPVGLLYRQVVNRRDPKPQGSPPRDFVALELAPERIVEALERYTDLLHHDARCELWLRGALGEQVVLDPDGLLYCYPDDPAFEDVLLGEALTDLVGQTIVDRDYAKHWFHGENDAVEDRLIEELRLVEVPHRKR